MLGLGAVVGGDCGARPEATFLGLRSSNGATQLLQVCLQNLQFIRLRLVERGRIGSQED